MNAVAKGALSLVFCVFASISMAQNQQNATAVEFDIEKVDKSVFDFAYVNPEADITQYSKIFVAHPTVVFDKRWLKEFGDKSTEMYREQIAKRYSKSFRKELVKYLTRQGQFKVVDKRAEDVLVLIPKIDRLDIKVPDEPGIKDTIIGFAGYAVADLTVYSPKEKTVVALIVDRKSTPQYRSAQSVIKARNANEKSFRKLFTTWSKKLSKYLSEMS